MNVFKGIVLGCFLNSLFLGIIVDMNEDVYGVIYEL